MGVPGLMVETQPHAMDQMAKPAWMIVCRPRTNDILIIIAQKIKIKRYTHPVPPGAADHEALLERNEEL